MRGRTAVILTTFASAFGVVSASSAGYDLILTIVIVEVIFSFVIGVVCILLSFNLFRALKDSNDAYTVLPSGEFPLSRGPSHNALNTGDADRSSEYGRTNSPHSPNDRDGNVDYSTFRDPRSMGSFGSDAEMDFEGMAEGYVPPNESNLFGVVKSVAGYLRLW